MGNMGKDAAATSSDPDAAIAFLHAMPARQRLGA
jgi:hypothetical protein